MLVLGALINHKLLSGKTLMDLPSTIIDVS